MSSLYEQMEAVRDACARRRQSLTDVQLISSDGDVRVQQLRRDVDHLEAAYHTLKKLRANVGYGNELSALRTAIIKHTEGDLFWVGEILLHELEKETGFNGAVSSYAKGDKE